ncbi:polysaccharide biosynthesis tyrosine autokinase [Flammeovirga pacifica]|uniref:non-specific protein-tyrosine kinase n=1 Tax=Flammeovirga pacifica TaxID=915059 RepID=A0A1S1YVX4_FLAPC|nr:polysaccharide biosynthesis tyrosine autokinase [Flammeovirga pacifica]OHX64955.1 hypothetical protein NH26_00630 [Flammeovirga pacifica]
MALQENIKFQEDKTIKELKKWFFLCLENWGWIILSVIISLGIGIVISMHQVSVYDIKADIVKKGNTNKSDGSELLSMLSTNTESSFSKVNIEYEQRFFTSKDVLLPLIIKENLNVNYFSAKIFKDVPLYYERPFTFSYDRTSEWVPFHIQISLNEISEEYFSLHFSDDHLNNKYSKKKFKYNEIAVLDGFKFKVIKNIENNISISDIFITLQDDDHIIKSLRRKIIFQQIGNANSDVPLFSISSKGALPNFEKKLISSLLSSVQDVDKKNKNFAIQQSAKFIQQQLEIISDSMQLIANDIYDLKTKNKELSGGANLAFEKIYTLDEKRKELQLSIRYCDYLLEKHKSGLDHDVIMPESYGITGSQLSSLLDLYTDLKLEDNLSNERIQNSIIFQEKEKEREKTLKSLNEKIGDAIQSTRSALNIRLQELNKELRNAINSSNVLLSEEKVLGDYERLFKTHEGLYQLLLEKQAEYNIRAASTISDYSIITEPESTDAPVYPNKLKNLMISVLLGALFPLGILYLLVIFDFKIRDEEDITQIVDTTYLGNLANIETSDKLIDPFTRSVSAESFRNIRTNLQFLVGDKDKFSIVFTSSISGEGKSVSSTNIANFYTTLEKKVLLVGADLRKPVLDTFYPQLNKNLGMSNYLSSGTTIEDYIQKSENENLDILLSGTIPPNPTELLQGKKMKELYEELQSKYDIVIYDSAPIGIVSDSRNLMRYADLVCFAVRQGYTPKAQLEKTIVPVTQMEDVKLALFMTDVKMHKKGGYQYSYYGKDYISYLEK